MENKRFLHVVPADLTPKLSYELGLVNQIGIMCSVCTTITEAMIKEAGKTNVFFASSWEKSISNCIQNLLEGSESDTFCFRVILQEDENFILHTISGVMEKKLNGLSEVYYLLGEA